MRTVRHPGPQMTDTCSSLTLKYRLTSSSKKEHAGIYCSKYDNSWRSNLPNHECPWNKKTLWEEENWTNVICESQCGVDMDNIIDSCLTVFLPLSHAILRKRTENPHAPFHAIKTHASLDAAFLNTRHFSSETLTVAQQIHRRLTSRMKLRSSNSCYTF